MIDSYDTYLPPAIKSLILSTSTLACSGVDAESGPWDLRVSPWSTEELHRAGGLAESQRITSHLETPDALSFVVSLYLRCLHPLSAVLAQRAADRAFIDEATSDLVHRAKSLSPLLFPHHPSPAPSVIGLRDAQGRVVIGPAPSASMRDATTPRGAKVAEIPSFLATPHVTLFGPPESPAMCINAVNALHRALPQEPEIVGQLLADCPEVTPFWGADDEDSRTPLRGPLLQAERNLQQCFDGSLTADDGKRAIMAQRGRLALPIKRFPGLALPMTTHFVRGEPLPLHLYDFALHAFHHRHMPSALCFYVPKLENEEEAGYLRHMIETAERMLDIPPGTVRVMVVLENPRAVFRLNEIMDRLYPYFAGASLGWHDYLASTARLFKNDPGYSIPVKSDPNIVLNHIKEAHLLLATVVGGRGGVAIGGMYGILPEGRDWRSPSFQIVLSGYIRDVIAQFRRGLRGFWVAHPDFVRLGVALVQAYAAFQETGTPDRLDALLRALILDAAELHALQQFCRAPDAVEGLDRSSAVYPRALLAAELKVSDVLPNHHPEEVRYNVFQALQYLADWLGGNGCVALPAYVRGVRVRVMDDLATTERSRWEVWAEVAHGRFSLWDFLRIVHEEMAFIRENRQSAAKQVRVLWDQHSAKWYPVAAQIFTALVYPVSGTPVEFATEYLLTFTVPEVRQAQDPWAAAHALAPELFSQAKSVDLFNFAFGLFSSQTFATLVATQTPIYDDALRIAHYIEHVLTEDDLVAGLAFFHHPFAKIVPKYPGLAYLVTPRADVRFAVDPSDDALQQLSQLLSQFYSQFGVPFVFSESTATATPDALLSQLAFSLQRQRVDVLSFVRTFITGHILQRLGEAVSHRAAPDSLIFSHPSYTPFQQRVTSLLHRFDMPGISLAVFNAHPDSIQSFGEGSAKVTENRIMCPDGGTWFELQSMSKTVAAAFTYEWFRAHALSIDTPVNELLGNPAVCRRPTDWRLLPSPGCPQEWAQMVTVRHLMEHSACGMHYCPGISPKRAGGMPPISELIAGVHEKSTGYPQVHILREPGSSFAYSGGGFMVLEHLMLCLSGYDSVEAMTRSFLDGCGLHEFTFDQHAAFIPQAQLAAGHDDSEDLLAQPSILRHAIGPHPAKPSRSDQRFRFISSDYSDRLMFPGFAAGGLGTCRSFARFLQHLTAAFHDLKGSGSISHATAVNMLGSVDPRRRNTGSFMAEGSAMGSGVFVLSAGENKFALHQAAGDGYRGIFVSCFSGPDSGKGFVIACNGNNNGVFLNSFAALAILGYLDCNGVDFATTFSSANFSLEGLAQEQIVNLGYKQLLFRAFKKSEAERVTPPGAPDPLSHVNLACSATVLSVTSDQFAAADNLLSPLTPVFQPAQFGRIGKLMDSWESSRHNPLPADVLELGLQTPSPIAFVSVSTMFHDGNHADSVRVQAFGAYDQTGFDLVPLSKLRGHALHRYAVPAPFSSLEVHRVRVYNYPDGGISRLGLFAAGALPAEEEAAYFSNKAGEGARYPVPIPPVIKRRTPKPLVDFPDLTPYLIPHAEVDIACSEFGGRVDRVTNQHYGPADSILSIYPPSGMFDGFETARSRRKESSEAVEISLGRPACLHRIIIDFTYFVANNPDSMAIEFLEADGKAATLMPQTWTKPYAGNIMEYIVPKHLRTIKIRQVRVISLPCGGFNRIHFMTRVIPHANL